MSDYPTWHLHTNYSKETVCIQLYTYKLKLRNSAFIVVLDFTDTVASSIMCIHVTHTMKWVSFQFSCYVLLTHSLTGTD